MIHPAAASVLGTVGQVANTVGNISNKINGGSMSRRKKEPVALNSVQNLPKVLQKILN